MIHSYNENDVNNNNEVLCVWTFMEELMEFQTVPYGIT